MKLSITFIIIFLVMQVSWSQEFCSPFYTDDFLNINALTARINAKGDMFYQPDINSGLLVFNETDSTDILTMIQAGLVLGAIDEAGEVRVNWRGYGHDGEDTDNLPGVLDSNILDSLHCEHWNKIWRVTSADIRAHLLEIQLYGTPQIRRVALYDYPARNNPFFSDYNDFALSENASLAPFFDANMDNLYNPDDGDYPLPANIDPLAIPDLLLWSVYNDAASVERPVSHWERLGVEIQQTTFAYHCPSNSLLHKTLFTQHRIINKSGQQLDSLFVGNRFDMEIGNFVDDCVGTAAELNTFYGYNCDEKDGFGYHTINRIMNGNIPVQAITFLNRSLDRSRFFYASGTSHFASHFMEPGHGEERFYHALNGDWSDGTPLTFGGNGYQENGGIPTPFIFPDNPNDSAGWSMLGNIRPYAEYRAVMTHHAGDLPLGGIFQLDQAWSIHRGENGNHLSNVDLMYEQIPQIQAWYDDGFANLPCLVSNTEIIDQQTEVVIYPNPTTGIVQVSMPAALVQSIDIFDSYGRLLKTIVATNIDLSEQTTGVYFLKIEMKSGELITRKIVKL